MDKSIKIGEKYHLIAKEKTRCGLKIKGLPIHQGPVPFGSMCEKCKQDRAMKEKGYF